MEMVKAWGGLTVTFIQLWTQKTSDDVEQYRKFMIRFQLVTVL
jgi:hypothetical protein